MLVAPIGGIGRGRLRIGGRNAAILLLYECVGNEVVDDGGADWRISPGPDDDARRGENLERIQHVEFGSCDGFTSLEDNLRYR